MPKLVKEKRRYWPPNKHPFREVQKNSTSQTIFYSVGNNKQAGWLTGGQAGRPEPVDYTEMHGLVGEEYNIQKTVLNIIYQY